jgi:hypothetical protein
MRKMRRFTRLTNAFSKKFEHHAHMVAIYTMWYNFVRVHKTLRAARSWRSRQRTRGQPYMPFFFIAPIWVLCVLIGLACLASTRLRFIASYLILGSTFGLLASFALSTAPLLLVPKALTLIRYEGSLGGILGRRELRCGAFDWRPSWLCWRRSGRLQAEPPLRLRQTELRHYQVGA